MNAVQHAPVRPSAGLDAPVLAVDNLSFSVGAGDKELLILKDISLQVRKREFVSIVGASGCGKTTLLRLLGGLLMPSKAPSHSRVGR